MYKVRFQRNSHFHQPSHDITRGILQSIGNKTPKTERQSEVGCEVARGARHTWFIIGGRAYLFAKCRPISGKRTQNTSIQNRMRRRIDSHLPLPISQLTAALARLNMSGAGEERMCCTGHPERHKRHSQRMSRHEAERSECLMRANPH